MSASIASTYDTSGTQATISEESSAARIKRYFLCSPLPLRRQPTARRPLIPKARKSKTVPQQPLRQITLILLLISSNIILPSSWTSTRLQKPLTRPLAMVGSISTTPCKAPLSPNSSPNSEIINNVGSRA